MINYMKKNGFDKHLDKKLIEGMIKKLFFGKV